MGRLDLKPAPGRPRRARSGDLAGILALEAASFPPEDRFPRASWRRILRSRSALAMVIPGAAEPVAAVAWLLRRGSGLARMYSLAVHPAARGQGLARRLLSASLAALPPRVAILSLEVRDDNQAAIALYCALGFVETARLPAYYGPGRHGLRMRCPRELVRQALAVRD